jgi:hypothetical protein
MNVRSFRRMGWGQRALTNTRQMSAVSSLEQPGLEVRYELAALCMHIGDVVHGSIAHVLPESPRLALDVKCLRRQC